MKVTPAEFRPTVALGKGFLRKKSKSKSMRDQYISATIHVIGAEIQLVRKAPWDARGAKWAQSKGKAEKEGLNGERIACL